MADTEPRRYEQAILTGALVVATFLVSFGALHYGFFTKRLLLDTPLYERYGDAVVHGGKIPYRDFGIEYPPGAIPVFAAPSVVASPGHFSLYARLFEALMLLCGASAAGLVAYVLTKQRASQIRLVAGTALAGLAPLALGPVVLSRFDLWPAALTMGALAALIGGRRRLGLAVLALAVAAKIYPAVLLPLALAYVWRLDGRRKAVEGGAIFAGVLAVCFVPFVALSPSGVWASFSGQASRPLQIESLGASLLLAAHQLWGVTLDQVASHGSDNLDGTLPHAFATLQSLLSVAVLGALWIAFARGEASRDRLIRYAAAAVCAFVALNKVLSPQYLIWLFALVPLIRGRRGAAAGALFVAAMVLTQLWFPQGYIGLVYGLDARASWFVVARDLTLVALLVTLAWPERRARRSAVTIVALLAATAATATAVGAATSGPSGVTRHSGLLDETGIESSCGVARQAPATSGGSVAYTAIRIPAAGGGASCVTVTLTAPPRIQLFSAAYREAFDPADPRAAYLGDAGRCTNVAGLSGRSVSYSADVARGVPVVVEVENCGPGSSVAPYTLDVTGDTAGAIAPAGYVAATSVRNGKGAGNSVTLRWRTSREAPGTSFGVYRDQGGRLIPVSRSKVDGRGPSGGTYSVTDHRVPHVRSVRYWLRARATGGLWSWHGPITTRG